MPANQRWASGAPVLVPATTRATFARNGKPKARARYDLGTAVALLTVQAESLGLAVHQMAGFDPEVARESVDLPGEYEPVTIFAIGYVGEASNLPEELASAEQSERQRKALDKIVFGSTWGDGTSVTF